MNKEPHIPEDIQSIYYPGDGSYRVHYFIRSGYWYCQVDVLQGPPYKECKLRKATPIEIIDYFCSGTHPPVEVYLD